MKNAYPIHYPAGHRWKPRKKCTKKREGIQHLFLERLGQKRREQEGRGVDVDVSCDASDEKKN